jgi:non-ribosomal peptide synthetase component F
MLAATLAATRSLFQFAPGDRMPCLARSSFDISLFELFSPLLTGGTAVLFPLRPALDVEHLVDRLGELTCLHAVPVLMREIVDALRRRGPSASTGRPPDVRGMRAVFTGGDAVPADLLDDLREVFPAARVWVLYGPTEATIVCAAHPVPPRPTPVRTLLGRPLPGAVLHVCDDRGGLLPPGVPGELWIGGPAVARGYLGRPGLTADKFVPSGGARFYRSGDRVRRLADGTLEFLGRLDHQVKVRGVRIEPGEIEAALAALPGVRQAAVAVQEGRSAGDRRLVAYVAGTAAVETLRESLRASLPEHMIPAAFVLLPALPLTPNGKVDKKALPAPDAPRSAAGWQAPRTPVEEVLANIWAELLGVERVGADGHFFELGGHSLLATRVTARLHGAFGVEVPLRDLFEAPVLADLAVRIETRLAADARPFAPPLVPVDREGPLPLSFAQQRLWFLDQLEPGSPLYNVSGALRAEGPLDAAVLARCLTEIVRRHEALRTTFTERDGEPFQVVQPPEPFGLPVIDLAGLPDRARALAHDEAHRPFDLRQGPLLRALLLRLAAEEHVLVLTVHHIASDGWSMGILIRELAALYPAIAEGRTPSLPELPVQYPDFAVWQRSWLRGEVLEQEIAFWRAQLAGLPPLLALPTDRPRPAVQSFRGAVRPVRLPSGLTRELEALARREGATLFMVLLAGFQTLLARLSGQDDLAVGSPVAGRTRVEVEGLIGFFVNTLVLRGDLIGSLPGGRAGEPAFRDLLARVRETALAAWRHQHLPFERLVEELAPERNLSFSPLFQVLFALQNAPAESLEFRDLRLHPVPLDRAGRTAKFDLALNLGEEDGALAGWIEYATDLFDAATIDRWIGHLEPLLAAAGSDQPIFDLPFLGETERAQLLPVQHCNEPRARREAPSTPVEEVLAGIWAEVLGIEQVGTNDHFFDLGGHSLLATRVMSRLRSAFRIEMPLRELFETPRLADLAARVEALLRTKTGVSAPPLEPRAPELRPGPLPLSFAQQRLWFIDQLDPGSPLYNVPVALRVEGPLDAAVLARCLTEIVRRHEALRTVFAAQDGAPVQVIRPAEPFLLSLVDLSDRSDLARALVQEEADRPFDFARDPLLRGVLLRLAEGDHVLALTMHHIASDGWSMGILVREVAALYAAFAAGRPSPLPELPVQYGDFALWQRSWLHGETLEQEIAFWRDQLAGLPPFLDLPTDRPRPAVQSFRGAARPVRLPAALTRELEALARREGATLFMVLLAGFQTLLARLSSQDDLAVGSPVAGRNREEIEGLIGFFVNTLVLRGDLSREPSFRDLLGQVRETALAAYVHQDLPFERLVDELAPERSLARSPLVQVLFALQNAPVENLEIAGLRFQPLRRAGTTAKLDLALNLGESGGAVAGALEYATDLFDAATIDRLAGTFERLLAAATNAPELRASELPLLDQAEQHQLQIEWNDSATPVALSVVELFETQARRTPDAVAVRLAGGEALTYAELDRRADALAARLRALGVGPEVPVGLSIEPSPELAVGLPSARSHPSTGATRVSAGGFGHKGGPEPAGPAGRGRGFPLSRWKGGPGRGVGLGSTERGPGGEVPRLPPLHLRHHRPTQSRAGRAHHARRHPRRHAACLRLFCHRPHALPRPLDLRHLPVRAAVTAPHRRHRPALPTPADARRGAAGRPSGGDHLPARRAGADARDRRGAAAARRGGAGRAADARGLHRRRRRTG